MRLAVLTTSYPRFPGDAAGRFVADAVEHVRRAVSTSRSSGPEQFRHFGIAYGHGVVGNLRRRPWLALFVPALLASFVRAARGRTQTCSMRTGFPPAGSLRDGQALCRAGLGHGRRAARRVPRSHAAFCRVPGW